MGQPDLFGTETGLPEGLGYRRDLLSGSEERALTERIAALDLKPFEFHGFLGNRRTASFGWHYAFGGGGLARTAGLPGWLLPLRERAATLAEVPADALEHALLIEYAPGAGIGWHRDRPVFGDVVGVSLLAPARLRFRRRLGEGWERASLVAEPRSAYVLKGPARGEWEHSIPPMETLRYSVTFRTLLDRAKRPSTGR